jgi:hypothetical protein
MDHLRGGWLRTSAHAPKGGRVSYPEVLTSGGCLVARGDSADRPPGVAWGNDAMLEATITVDTALKDRLTDLASQTGQQVDGFVAALLRRIAEADVRFEDAVRCVPAGRGADIDRRRR